MSISIISIKCPDCGANLDVEQGRRLYFCSYCGTKIAVINENEFTFHEIDEAAIEHERQQAAVEITKEKEETERERIRANPNSSSLFDFLEIGCVGSIFILMIVVYLFERIVEIVSNIFT